MEVKANVISAEIVPSLALEVAESIPHCFNFEKYSILPGFCDVHVHLREPGFSYKETISTGTEAALKGGYTVVCTMPNLNPVPDSLENLKTQQDLIVNNAKIAVYPYASITVSQAGEKLSDMQNLADKVIAFSDDGKGIQSEEMMLQAMLMAKQLNKIIVAHCEDNSLLFGGYIHDGKYAIQHGHKGISSKSEWIHIERDVNLADKTKCPYHVCHISTKESVEIIRQAKKSGIDVTCETAPHYLLLDENDLQEDGRFKMNPPLRSSADRTALLEGICDGTIDMIATDHAPHSQEEKSRGLALSAFGIVGLETAFPLLYTYLVKKNVITMNKLVQLMAINPRKRFHIPFGGYSIWDLSCEYEINPQNFASKGRATPFANMKVFGKQLYTKP